LSFETGLRFLLRKFFSHVCFFCFSATIQITFVNTDSTTLLSFEQDLIDAMATSLGIDSSLISVTLTDFGNGVVVTYSLLGDYSTQINSSSFQTIYYASLQNQNSDLYALSQGTGGATSTHQIIFYCPHSYPELFFHFFQFKRFSKICDNNRGKRMTKNSSVLAFETDDVCTM
jgi:hypothetical protein